MHDLAALSHEGFMPCPDRPFFDANKMVGDTATGHLAGGPCLRHHSQQAALSRAAEQLLPISREPELDAVFSLLRVAFEGITLPNDHALEAGAHSPL